MPQSDKIQDDTIGLRNGTSSVEVENRGASSTDDGGRNTGGWLDRNAPFRERARMMRYRDWSNPQEVIEDEADLLRQLVALPESFEREFTVQAFLGSEKVLRRCWKAYRSWAQPEPAMGMAARSGQAAGD
jgi:hypothetical protein